MQCSGLSRSSELPALGHRLCLLCLLPVPNRSHLPTDSRPVKVLTVSKPFLAVPFQPVSPALLSLAPSWHPMLLLLLGSRASLGPEPAESLSPLVPRGALTAAENLKTGKQRSKEPPRLWIQFTGGEMGVQIKQQGRVGD